MGLGPETSSRQTKIEPWFESVARPPEPEQNAAPKVQGWESDALRQSTPKVKVGKGQSVAGVGYDSPRAKFNGSLQWDLRR